MRVPNMHFDPESRQLQTARLEHLLNFSDLVVLLIADQGLGRSHILSHLRPEQSPMQPNWVQLSLDTSFDVTQLLESLIAQLGVSCELNNRARLTALHTYSRGLQETDQQLVICIDDADYLSDNALELLINFSRVDNAAPRILLSGLPDFEQRFFDREFNRLVEGALHIEHLQPYTAEEARAFVEAHLMDGRVLKDSQYRRLLTESNGRPDQLKVALAKLIDSSASGSSHSRTNRWYWAGISLVLGIISISFAYLYYPSSEESVPIAQPLSIAIPQVQMADTQSPTALVEARTELARRIAQQEAKLSQVTQASDVAVENQIPIVPVAETVIANTSPQLVTPSNIATVQEKAEDIPDAAQPEQRSEVNNEMQPRVNDRISTEENQKTAATNLPGPGESVLTLAQQPPGFSVKSQANPVGDTTYPTTIKSGNDDRLALSLAPSAAVTSAANSVNSSPTQSAAGSNPVSERQAVLTPATVNTTPVSSGVFDSKLDPAIDQVLAWPASDVTVQLLAARVEETADKLMVRHSQINGILKLKYPFKGAPRYTLVLGHFPSRDAAARAVSDLPADLQRLKPWIRSVAGLKAELNQVFNP